MPLDEQDSAQLNYKAQIRYYQQRIAGLQSGFVNPAVAATTAVDPDIYISNLNDLGFKVTNLTQRIASASAGLQIPVNATTEPNVADAVLSLDPNSNGEYISFETYSNALNQINAGVANLNVENLITSASNDPTSNSQLMQSSIYGGYAAFAGQPVSSSATYNDTIQTWGGTDNNIQQVVNFANSYLSTFPSTAYTPWAFASDMAAESTQISNLTNLWNSFSITGSQGLSSLGGSLQTLPPLVPDKNIVQFTDTYLNYTNSALNGIDNLLNNINNIANSICLANFIASLNLGNISQLIQDLEGLSVALQLLKVNVNFDFKDLLSSFENVLSNIMRNIILNQLFNILLQMSQRVFQPINNWIATAEKKVAPILNSCPAASQLVQYLVGSVGFAESQINDMIVEMMKNLELKNIQSSAKLSQATTISNIVQMISMIQKIEVIVSSLQSTVSDPASILSGVTLNISSQSNVPTAYAYPLASNPNIYNTFPAAVPKPVLNAPSLNIIPDPIQWAA